MAVMAGTREGRVRGGIAECSLDVAFALAHPELGGTRLPDDVCRCRHGAQIHAASSNWWHASGDVNVD